MMPLLPVALGGILASLVASVGSGEPASTPVLLGGLAALVLLGALGVRWVLLLAGYALFLEVCGGTAIARSCGPIAEGPVALVPWVVAVTAKLRAQALRALPPIAILLVLDVILAALDDHPRARTLVLVAFVLSLFALAPLVVRLLFPTRPLDLTIEGLRVRLWDLGVPIATASVAGMMRLHRTIFVTPALVRVMEPHEGAAVLRHELGHGELGHLRAVALLAAAMLVLVDELEAIGPVWLGALLAAATLGFILLARRLEHDADLYAARASGPDAVAAALLKCCAVNGQSPERGGLRHPSAAKRIALLQRTRDDPTLAERRLGRSRALLAALDGLALLVLGAASLRALLGR